MNVQLLPFYHIYARQVQVQEIKFGKWNDECYGKANRGPCSWSVDLCIPFDMHILLTPFLGGFSVPTSHQTQKRVIFNYWISYLKWMTEDYNATMQILVARQKDVRHSITTEGVGSIRPYCKYYVIK